LETAKERAINIKAVSCNGSRESIPATFELGQIRLHYFERYREAIGPAGAMGRLVMSFSHRYACLFLVAFVVLLPVALAAGCPICHTA
jgi:hypothetical protein